MMGVADGEQNTGELIGNLSFSTLQILVRELISLYRIQDEGSRYFGHSVFSEN